MSAAASSAYSGVGSTYRPGDAAGDHSRLPTHREWRGEGMTRSRRLQDLIQRILSWAGTSPGEFINVSPPAERET